MGNTAAIVYVFMEEECFKMNIEEMKWRPLFALLSNEMNRTRKKECERMREGKENSALFRMTD